MNEGIGMMKYINTSDDCIVVANTGNRTVTLYTTDDDGIKSTTVIPFHEKMSGSNISQSNGRIFIDGFELIGGEWRRAARVLLHYIF